MFVNLTEILTFNTCEYPIKMYNLDSSYANNLEIFFYSESYSLYRKVLDGQFDENGHQIYENSAPKPWFKIAIGDCTTPKNIYPILNNRIGESPLNPIRFNFNQLSEDKTANFYSIDDENNQILNQVFGHPSSSDITTDNSFYNYNLVEKKFPGYQSNPNDNISVYIIPNWNWQENEIFMRYGGIGIQGNTYRQEGYGGRDDRNIISGYGGRMPDEEFKKAMFVFQRSLE